MKSRLLEFLACPECSHEDLELETFHADAEEIMDGVLRCAACGRSYPIIAGVPRMLPDGLMGALRHYHPEFFRRYDVPIPAFTESNAVTRTLDFFTMQRPELYTEMDTGFLQYLRHHLDIRIPWARELFGQVGLDAGCGEGRYGFCLTRYGAEVIGMDLGNSVDLAFVRTKGNAKFHVVQGSIYSPPLRRRSLDFVFSIGVLHHLPSPEVGFRALAPLLRPGGSMQIWVYALHNMSFVYRMSHLTSLRSITSRLSPRTTLALSIPIACALEGLVFVPVNLLAKAGLRDHLHPQLLDVASLPFRVKVAEVHDRIGAPVTHFPTRDQVEQWFEQARLTAVEVMASPGGRGWSARGFAPKEPGAQASEPTAAAATAMQASERF